jgi:putative tricarboxylic transport membrane protein
MTCLDGNQMAKQGRAGPALGIAAFGSFIAGTLGLIGLMLMAKPLATFAVAFGPAEYFSLMCLGLSLITYLTQGSTVKGLAMAGIGLFLSLIGQDVVTGRVRFTLGFYALQDGLGLVPLVMGLFGISEVLSNLVSPEERVLLKTKIRRLLPNKEDWRQSAKPIGRGSLLGFFLGILPGGGAVIASFVSYAVEKRFSRHPERFGRGAIEGVAGPESANNSATSGAFIPLFSLGIPSNVIMALLLGALMIHGIRPGPLLITEHPEIFWGVVASMYVGNIMLVILNLPLIGLWVKILSIPYRVLFPLILLFCLIGSYSISCNVFDIFVMIFFGLVGLGFRHMGYEPAPLVLAFVLGPMLEQNLRQALILSDGSAAIFVTQPLSAACLAISAILLMTSIYHAIRGRSR